MNKLKVKLAEKGISQTQLADYLGVRNDKVSIACSEKFAHIYEAGLNALSSARVVKSIKRNNGGFKG